MSNHEVASVRTEGDSWAITESVGATALWVAACRSAETAQPDPLIRDEFAAQLVSPAGPAWARLASGSLDWLDADDEYGRRVNDLARNYQAVRTHFFDAYFADAAAAGIRQMVILAAGLDSRAYRLDWPSGCTVYEIDQPEVLAYKAETLDAAAPAATRRPVPVDLRGDWPAALLEAGFDPAHRTAWLAEGLLPYLPADAQDRLFETVSALSAAGSRVAVEAFGGATFNPDGRRRLASRERQARLRQHLGLDVNLEALVYREDNRAEAADQLGRHGWRVQEVDSHQEAARLGRPVPEDLSDQTSAPTLLTGER